VNQESERGGTRVGRRLAGSQRRHWHAWTKSHAGWGAKLGFENP